MLLHSIGYFNENCPNTRTRNGIAQTYKHIHIMHFELKNNNKNCNSNNNDNTEWNWFFAPRRFCCCAVALLCKSNQCTHNACPPLYCENCTAIHTISAKFWNATSESAAERKKIQWCTGYGSGECTLHAHFIWTNY